jgi:hypothetical protein
MLVDEREYFAPYLAWADSLIRWRAALDAETAVDGLQRAERWGLLIGLFLSGANAFWSFAATSDVQRDKAHYSRGALAQERERQALVVLLDPQIVVRRPGDLSPLLESSSLQDRELLSSRAREDMAYLQREPAVINPALADQMLRRLPSGVLAWA